MPLQGFIEPRKEDVKKYTSMGWWQDLTLGEMLDRTAGKYPDREALVEGDRRFTYQQLKDEADRLAIGLMKTGIRRGDSVMVQLPNWHEFVPSFFALHKIGAVAVLLLSRHMQIEINHLCGLTGARAGIVPERYRSTDYGPVIDEVRRENPQLESIISVRGGGNPAFLSYEKLIEGSELTEKTRRTLIVNRPHPGEVAMVLATGGTTGLPKVVPRTHYSAVCEARYKAEAREQTDKDTCLIAVPMEHNLGLAGMTSTFYTGGRTVLLDSTRMEDFCETIERERVTRAPIVPTLLARIADYDGVANHDLSSLKALYVGGAKTATETIETIHRRIGPVYLTAFGMSEGPTCMTHPDDVREVLFNSIGRPCCPHDEFRTVDADGNELPKGEEGELQAKGPGVFSGYLDNPEENRRAFTPDGYFRTGDMAVIDGAGNIAITGRIKDIIIRGGENISPAEIEHLVSQHPDIAEVAVIGLPDEQLGERACACVILKSGTELTLEEVVAFLRERGASVLQLPERLEIITEIPLTNIGKPDKIALRQSIVERTGG